MKTNGIIFKGTASILLAVIFYMHLCSTMCATGINMCCDMKDDGDHRKEECCSHKESSNKEKDCRDNGCQDMHFAFFGATGQSVPPTADFSIDPFPSLIAVIIPSYNLQLLQEDKALFNYNIFHPPPLKADIFILYRSFLI